MQKEKETYYPVIYHNLIYSNQILKYICNIQKKHILCFHKYTPPFSLFWYMYIYIDIFFKGGIIKVLNSNWSWKLQL